MYLTKYWKYPKWAEKLNIKLKLFLLPTDMEQIKIFNIKLNPLRKEEFIEIINHNIKNGILTIQNGVNAASINELVKNEELAKAYNNSDLINIDGMSMVWALRFLGHNVPERVACPDLALDILDLAQREDFSIYLLGAKRSILSLSIKKLRNSYPKLSIAGYHHGYFDEGEEESIVKSINETMPDILFLGLPSPKKELFVEKYKDRLKVKYILGIGGFIDILSGKTKRAPKWLQNIGMEWFYRLIQEPRRMWPRYGIGNFKFIRLVLKEKMNNGKAND